MSRYVQFRGSATCLGPPKPGKRASPSAGWELQIWEFGYDEFTSYLVKTIISTFLEVCTEERMIDGACGEKKPWHYYDERTYDTKEESRQVFSKWKEWYSKLIAKP